MRSEFVIAFITVITILLMMNCNGIGNRNMISSNKKTDHIQEQDIASIQLLVEKGDLTAKELTEYYLLKIKEIDKAGPGLNAILQINPEAVKIAVELDQERRVKGPRGPMHGIPVVLKANIDTGDQLSTTAGSLALSDHFAEKDAFLVSRLRDAGMVILGKANLSEWANFRSEHSSSGWSSEGGQTKNPYILDRNPCGSSSGSAVAVAANLTVVSVGTETDGSVVCPSGTNGIVGIKPTLGLISRHGIIPIAHSQDTAGPMARTVSDAALLLSVMVAKDINDPLSHHFPKQIPNYLSSRNSLNLKGIRIGIMRDYHGAGVNSNVEKQFESAINRLKSLGAVIIDPIPLGDLNRLNQAEKNVLLYEFRSDLKTYLQSHDSPNNMQSLEDVIAFNRSHHEEIMPFFGQEIFLKAVKKGPLTDKAYENALESSQKLAQRTIDGAMAEYQIDAIMAPTNAPAWVTDLLSGDNWSSAISSSSLPAVAGYPNITVPMGEVYGLPVGVSFFGRAYSEPKLLHIAYAFEQRTKARKPPEYILTLDLK